MRKADSALDCVVLRVAIDTNGMYVTRAGTARYIQGLLNGLAELDDPSLAVIPLRWPVENLSYTQPARALKTFYREKIWARMCAPRELRRERADVYHATASLIVQPPLDLPWVATLLDLAVLRHPERFRPWHRWQTRQMLERLRRVDRIITISRFTADEAIKLLELPASRMEVVYLGAQFSRADEVIKPGLPDTFFLFVGSLEPGKNLALLKSAYEMAATRGVHLPPLLIVGSRWHGVESEGRPPHAWDYLGRISDEELSGLYRRALALVFPSKYEGFGLPVVEAMAHGCPVICSPVASLPEVGGDAALYCELSPAAYLETMLAVMNDDNNRRTETVAAGRQQAARFTWKKCAEQTRAVYQQAREGKLR